MRTLKGPGTAGIHRVIWDLKRQDKTTDEDADQALEWQRSRNGKRWIGLRREQLHELELLKALAAI